MTKYEFLRDGVRAELRDELVGAGLPEDVVVQSDNQRVWVWCEDNQLAAVQAVVANHNPDAYRQRETAELDQFRQDRSRLRTFLETPNANLTLPAVVIAVKALIRVVQYLVREARDTNG